MSKTLYIKKHSRLESVLRQVDILKEKIKHLNATKKILKSEMKLLLKHSKSAQKTAEGMKKLID